MDKPYQRDIELLRKELECYKYVADNCKKEHSEQFQRYLTTTCLELRYAIDTMEERQKIAVKELEVLPLRERERMLEPLFQAAEEISDNAKGNPVRSFPAIFSSLLQDFSHGSGGLQIPARIKANNRCM